MKSPQMESFLEKFTMDAFGRSRDLAKAGCSCVICGGPATEFRDEISKREYNITMSCQKCQDKIFSE